MFCFVLEYSDFVITCKQAYLSGLGKKSKLPSTKSKEIDWEHFDNVDDLSDENVPPKKKSPEAKFGAGGSKFLKKKIPENKETKLNNIVKKGKFN